MKYKNIKIFAMAINWPGFSGGDRVFIELARRWSKKINIDIYTWKAGFRVFEEQKLRQHDKLKFIEWKKSELVNNVFVLNYFSRILYSILNSLTLEIENPKDTLLFSASEFWMDSFPAFILKVRYPETKWVAAWYQTAPNPFIGFSESKKIKRHRLRAFVYWLVQQPAKLLIKGKADYIFVNNEEEKKVFPKQNKEEKVIVVLGAVRLDDIENWILKIGKLPKVYDAVFQGRFHPQKGVVELVDIWKKVVEKKPDAKLAMIGDGPLRKNVEYRIKNLGLEKNIKLFGYVFDGPQKYRIFSQSKIVVHPAFYDSGGMATAEAMAFGIPAIGFNLKAYKSYYPKGMEKVEKGNLDAFAKKIIDLLSDEDKRKILGVEGYEFIKNNYTWDKRSEETLERISR